jgi:DNA-binding transcriptional MerR regulator
MDYRVEEIARAAGVAVDTVRFYQSRGLLPPPERRGRIAIYGDAHLERVRRIRELNRQGLTLEAVRRVLEEREARPDGRSDGDERARLRDALLGALERAEGARGYTPAELAAAADLPEPFLDALRRAALLEPGSAKGRELYSDADLSSARAARSLLAAGLPLEDLLPLAKEHAAHVRATAERAVELFDRSVRRAGSPDELPRERVVELVQELLPAAATLVALHFQRALIDCVRARLARDGAGEGAATVRTGGPWSG